MDSVWNEWKALTRFQASAQMAFAREKDLWTQLQLADPAGVKISTPARGGVYSVTLQEHVDAVSDEQTLFASVLIHSYALTESAACEQLNIPTREAGGIESWGARLLADSGQGWEKVHGGLAGAVEVAVVRNAFSHGGRIVDASASQRLVDAGGFDRFAGMPVRISEEELGQYRSTLRSIMRLGKVK